MVLHCVYWHYSSHKGGNDAAIRQFLIRGFLCFYICLGSCYRSFCMASGTKIKSFWAAKTAVNYMCDYMKSGYRDMDDYTRTYYLNSPLACQFCFSICFGLLLKQCMVSLCSFLKLCPLLHR